MIRVLNNAKQACSRVRDFAVLLIAAGIAIPAFAATGLPLDLTSDEWRMVLLIGSVVLVGIAVLLKIRQKRQPPIPVWPVTTQPTRHPTIGEDRPNAYH
jgi:hypothetical protein